MVTVSRSRTQCVAWGGIAADAAIPTVVRSEIQWRDVISGYEAGCEIPVRLTDLPTRTGAAQAEHEPSTASVSPTERPGQADNTLERK